MYTIQYRFIAEKEIQLYHKQDLVGLIDYIQSPSREPNTYDVYLIENTELSEEELCDVTDLEIDVLSVLKQLKVKMMCSFAHQDFKAVDRLIYQLNAAQVWPTMWLPVVDHEPALPNNSLFLSNNDDNDSHHALNQSQEQGTRSSSSSSSSSSRSKPYSNEREIKTTQYSEDDIKALWAAKDHSFIGMVDFCILEQLMRNDGLTLEAEKTIKAIRRTSANKKKERYALISKDKNDLEEENHQLSLENKQLKKENAKLKSDISELKMGNSQKKQAHCNTSTFFRTPNGVTEHDHYGLNLTES